MPGRCCYRSGDAAVVLALVVVVVQGLGAGAGAVEDMVCYLCL